MFGKQDWAGNIYTKILSIYIIFKIMEKCLSCLSNSGVKRINPGEIIYEGNYWLAEHVYPTGLSGWLVIVLKRHIEKLHELTLEEWIELGEINYRLSGALKTILNTEKEYSCCFAEMEGFRHIHFHLIPKTAEFKIENNGSKVFNYLRVSENDSVSKERIIELCTLIKNELKK